MSDRDSTLDISVYYSILLPSAYDIEVILRIWMDRIYRTVLFLVLQSDFTFEKSEFSGYYT